MFLKDGDGKSYPALHMESYTSDVGPVTWFLCHDEENDKLVIFTYDEVTVDVERVKKEAMEAMMAGGILQLDQAAGMIKVPV
jgi:hypothetical protein